MSSRSKSGRSGFSLIEIMIAVGIIAILGVVTAINLSGGKRKADLDSTTKEIAVLLREAQSNSASQSRGVGWGVHLDNATTTAPFYALFASTTYSTSTINGYYRLPPTVGYLTSTLASGSSTNITFSQVTGAASASTSIRIYLLAQPSLSSTISVASSGAVSY